MSPRWMIRKQPAALIGPWRLYRADPITQWVLVASFGSQKEAVLAMDRTAALQRQRAAS